MTFPQENMRIKMFKNPSVKRAKFEVLETAYEAPNFVQALGAYVTKLESPGLTGAEFKCRAAVRSQALGILGVPVFHRVRFFNPDAQGEGAPPVLDAIHARPAPAAKRGQTTYPRFDTVLVNTRSASNEDSDESDESETGRKEAGRGRLRRAALGAR